MHKVTLRWLRLRKDATCWSPAWDAPMRPMCLGHGKAMGLLWHVYDMGLLVLLRFFLWKTFWVCTNVRRVCARPCGWEMLRIHFARILSQTNIFVEHSNEVHPAIRFLHTWAWQFGFRFGEADVMDQSIMTGTIHVEKDSNIQLFHKKISAFWSPKGLT